MASFPCCFLISILVFLHVTSSTQTCETRYCGNPTMGPSIQYPFHLRGVNESSNCGSQGFEVFCDNSNQTLLTLPNAGDFVVKNISLAQKKAWMNDPQDCLPARFLHGINLPGSPFQWSSDYHDFIYVAFLNCTAPVPDSVPFTHKVRCLSTDEENYSVVAALLDPAFPRSSPIRGCQQISSALVPIDNVAPDLLLSNNLYSDIQLQWNNPECIYCENFQVCGFSGDSGPDHDSACNLPSPDEELPRSDPDGKIEKLLGVGIAGAVCFTVAGLTHLLSAKMEAQTVGTTESETNTAESGDVRMGIDRSTIEQYPKIQIGHSGRLPNSTDNVCSICLCEYEPKETIRTIPHCSHYFHANCIDGWLKMNATCPLCRHLPHDVASASHH